MIADSILHIDMMKTVHRRPKRAEIIEPDDDPYSVSREAQTFVTMSASELFQFSSARQWLTVVQGCEPGGESITFLLSIVYVSEIVEKLLHCLCLGEPLVVERIIERGEG